MIVIDASVVVKIFLDEPGTEEAIMLLETEAGEISTPDILAVEVASTLVREANADKPSGDAMRKKLAFFASLVSNGAITLVRSTGRDVDKAANLAIDLGHPLRDCIYLALAMELDCALVTADTRFASKASAVWDQVRVLGA